MALALHPHVLARAQAEIDGVVGDERCPAFSDEAQLPYLRATVREVLRWRPSGPTAIPHATIKVCPFRTPQKHGLTLYRSECHRG